MRTKAMDRYVLEPNSSLTLCEYPGLDDWYAIEAKGHDGSARITDGDVEGSAEDMLKIADAIECRGYLEEKRCAVSLHRREDEACFWSPKNSSCYAVVPLSVADELAKEIREKLGHTRRRKTVAGVREYIAGRIDKRKELVAKHALDSATNADVLDELAKVVELLDVVQQELGCAASGEECDFREYDDGDGYVDIGPCRKCGRCKS